MRLILAAVMAFVLAPPLTAAAQDHSIGRWAVHSEPRGATAITVSTNRMPGTSGEADRTVLTVGCYNGGYTGIHLDLKVPLRHTGNVPVTWRFDRGPVQTLAWQADALDSLDFPAAHNPGAFLNRLQTAHALTVAVAGSRSLFDLAGGAQAIPEVRNLCHTPPSAR